MKLSSLLIGLAGGALVVAFASSSALAQSPNVFTNSIPRTLPHWTASNVSTERPFGTIDTAAAGSSVSSVRLWTLGRSVSERYEINGRCGVITAPANAELYGASDRQFCRNYAMAGFARPIRPRS